jgi:type I restriction-modification system DNA methylase subunit
MSEVINELLFKLYVMDMAEYETDKLLEKSREEIVKEVEELSARDREEFLESHGTTVDETFEDGGRWSNYVTSVYRFYHNREYIYVQVSKEVPATEMQDGGDFEDPEIEQVFPHKVESVVYKRTPQETTKTKGTK